MFNQLSKSMYAYIQEIELMIFMRYKVNPFEMISRMTILDLQAFMLQLTHKIEEDDKKQQDDNGGNRLMKSLVAIRDILNYMTLNDSNVR